MFDAMKNFFHWLKRFLDGTRASFEKSRENLTRSREDFESASRRGLVSFRKKTEFLRGFFSIPPIGLSVFVLAQAAYIIPLSFLFGINIFTKRSSSSASRRIGKTLLAGAFLGYAALGKYHSDKGDGTPVPFIPARELIKTGPYGLVRNPMFILHAAGVIGLAFLVGALRFTFGVVPSFLFLNLNYLKNVEERDLEERFGEEYKIYRKKTPFIIPDLRR
jgi:protein-S-isoprenylcysteine O-methyltransferase Ste14